MKKLPFAFFLIFVFALFNMIPYTAYADNQTLGKYNIQVESLEGSDDAKELNSYRKEFTKYLNQKVKWQIEAEDNDSYSYVSKSDLDFNDTSKIYGLKFHGLYTKYEQFASYDSFMNDLGECYKWRICINKDGTLFDMVIYKSNNTNTYGDIIGGDWYVDSCYVCNYLTPYYDPEVITKNTKRMLRNNNETDKDVKLVFFELDRLNGIDCAVVFVNNYAKYIYSYGMDFPAYKLSNETPQEIRDVISRTNSAICNNSDNQNTNTKVLYSYNMIMAFYSLCEYYSKSK